MVYSQDYVEKYLLSIGCELLGKYVNTKIKIKFRCSCGRIRETNFTATKLSSHCHYCSSNKFSREGVEKYFKEHGCELLGHYVRAVDKIKYRCSCGTISFTTYESFKRGHRCMKCGLEKIRGRRKTKYEDAKIYYQEHGCELLEPRDRYGSVVDKMRFKCSCGNVGHTTFRNFKNGVRCSACGIESGAKARKTPFEDIIKYFKSRGCELISLPEEYALTRESKLRYRCSCSRECATTLASFKISKHTCKQCSLPIGEKHPRWKKNRKKHEADQKFKRRITGMVRASLERLGESKKDKSFFYLGYKHSVLKNHITHHPNWGRIKGKWHIDHIFPIQAFLDYKIRDIKLINCLENLQPLPAKENIAKSDNYDRIGFEKWLAEKGVKVRCQK